MKRVIIESPYAGDTPDEVAANVEYARRCMLDSLRRGEAPFLSHLLYTQVLDDKKLKDRRLGIEAGFAWVWQSDFTAVYLDRGITAGMRKGIKYAREIGHRIEYRKLP